MNDIEPTDHDATDPDDHVEPDLVFGPEQPEVVSGETLDALPVVADVRVLQARSPVIAPVQAAAVAATGFLAGAAALALLNRRGGRRLAEELTDLRELRERYETARGGQTPFGMVPGRSYLIQIRVLGRPPE